MLGCWTSESERCSLSWDSIASAPSLFSRPLSATHLPLTLRSLARYTQPKPPRAIGPRTSYWPATTSPRASLGVKENRAPQCGQYPSVRPGRPPLPRPTGFSHRLSLQNLPDSGTSGSRRTAALGSRGGTWGTSTRPPPSSPRPLVRVEVRSEPAAGPCPAGVGRVPRPVRSGVPARAVSTVRSTPFAESPGRADAPWGAARGGSGTCGAGVFSAGGAAPTAAGWYPAHPGLTGRCRSRSPRRRGALRPPAQGWPGWRGLHGVQPGGHPGGAVSPFGDVLDGRQPAGEGGPLVPRCRGGVPATVAVALPNPAAAPRSGAIAGERGRHRWLHRRWPAGLRWNHRPLAGPVSRRRGIARPPGVGTVSPGTGAREVGRPVRGGRRASRRTGAARCRRPASAPTLRSRSGRSPPPRG